VRIGVLASGSGTNLQALMDAAGVGGLGPGRLAVVGSNVAGCGALIRARNAEIPHFVISHDGFKTRDLYDAALRDALRAHTVDLVVLAGFMRILGSAFLDAFPDRVVNVHPALLPAFPGAHAQRQAVAYGAKISGCTVHFVDAGVDTGPIIAQAAVPVMDDDDEASLRDRILIDEHRLLPAVVRSIAEGRVTRDGRVIRTRA